MSQDYNDIPGAKGCQFSDLQPDEKLLMVVRRHWIILVIISAYASLFILLTGALLLLLPLTDLSNTLIYILVILTWFYGSMFLFIKWLDYELDFFIVTDKRIIGFDQVGFLNRKTVQASIDQVQEVFAVHKGILPSILHYGELHVQTASETTELVLPMVNDALDTSRTIHNFIEENRMIRAAMPAQKEDPTPKQRIDQLLK